MNKHFSQKVIPMLVTCVLVTTLTGCQSLNQPNINDANIDHSSENDGEHIMTAAQVPEALAKKKTQYNIQKSLTSRANEIWAKSQNEVLSDQDYTELSDIYAKLQLIDPKNTDVSDGLLAIEQEKRHQTLITQSKQLIAQGNNDAALEKVHLVLLENHNHAHALRIYHQLSNQQEANLKEKAKYKLSYNKPITMEFRDVEIKKMFEALAKTTGINFVIDNGVDSEEQATIFINGMNFGDALDLILQSNDLNKKIIGDNAVIIYSNYSASTYQDLSVRTYNLDYADAKVMQGILKSMLNIKHIQVDPRLNTLIIKGSPEILALAEKLITAQDKPDAEVMLEMQVLEVTRSYLQDLGVNTPTSLSVPIPANGNLTASDVGNVTSGKLIVTGVPGITFNETNGNVNLLANPRIRVRNKHLAKIHIGEKVPVFTANVASTGVTTQTVQYIDAGLKLEAEPTISASDDVNIKLTFNVGSIGAAVTSGGSTAFRVGTRFTTTELRLHDGETQVIAGLIQDQDSKNVSGIPGLKDMPLLGRLFSLNSDSQTKTEIILSITPHIIRPRKAQLSNEAEIWIGSDKRKGRSTRSPGALPPGVMPFMIPKPAPSAPTTQRNNPNMTPEMMQNLNLQLPPGFTLGNGLNGGNAAPSIPIPPSQ
jgi:general secretion pathway protein D